MLQVRGQAVLVHLLEAWGLHAVRHYEHFLRYALVFTVAVNREIAPRISLLTFPSPSLTVLRSCQYL